MEVRSRRSIKYPGRLLGGSGCRLAGKTPLSRSDLLMDERQFKDVWMAYSVQFIVADYAGTMPTIINYLYIILRTDQ